MKKIISAIFICCMLAVNVFALFCPQCGTSNPDSAKFCTNCGSKMPSAGATEPDKTAAPTVEPSRAVPAATKDTSFEQKKFQYDSKKITFVPKTAYQSKGQNIHWGMGIETQTSDMTPYMQGFSIYQGENEMSHYDFRKMFLPDTIPGIEAQARSQAKVGTCCSLSAYSLGLVFIGIGLQDPSSDGKLVGLLLALLMTAIGDRAGKIGATTDYSVDYQTALRMANEYNANLRKELGL
jgi:hypothetical protein